MIASIPTNKTPVAIRLEGTILKGSWEENEQNDEVIGRMHAQKDDLYFVVVTPLTQADAGAKLVIDWLNRNDVPWDDVWCGHGIPNVDYWYDNNAGTI